MGSAGSGSAGGRCGAGKVSKAGTLGGPLSTLVWRRKRLVFRGLSHGGEDKVARFPRNIKLGKRVGKLGKPLRFLSVVRLHSSLTTLPHGKVAPAGRPPRPSLDALARNGSR